MSRDDDDADAASKEVKLWGGRFEESVTEKVEKFTESISFDKVLYKQDIMGSKAHATMLAHQVPLCLTWCFLLIDEFGLNITNYWFMTEFDFFQPWWCCLTGANN